MSHKDADSDDKASSDNVMINFGKIIQGGLNKSVPEIKIPVTHKKQITTQIELQDS